MKWHHSLSLALAIVAVAPVAQAQTDTSDKMWQNFYVKLAAVIRGGNEEDPNQVVALSVPGTPIKPMQKNNANDIVYVNGLLDEGIRNSPRLSKSQQKYSAIWDYMLKYAKPDQGKPLTAEESAKLEAAIKLTDPDGEKMLQYEKYQLEYDQAEDELNNAQAEAIAKGDDPTNISKTYRSRMTQVERRWEGKNLRKEIDSAFDDIRELGARDLRTYWRKLREIYDKNKFKDTLRVVTYPGIEDWASDSGWMKFKYRASQTSEVAKFNKKAVEASLSLNVGKFKGSAEANWSKMASDAMSNDSSLVITMEVKRVHITRPWVDWQVVQSANWGWATGTKTISDGKGGGEMPVYTDSIIIVRKVKFYSKSLQKFKKEMEENLKIKAEGSYGPFVSGNVGYNSEDKSTDSGSSEAVGSISIPEPQIVAYVGTVVPPCPASVLGPKK